MKFEELLDHPWRLVAYTWLFLIGFVILAALISAALGY